MSDPLPAPAPPLRCFPAGPAPLQLQETVASCADGDDAPGCDLRQGEMTVLSELAAGAPLLPAGSGSLGPTGLGVMLSDMP